MTHTVRIRRRLYEGRTELGPARTLRQILARAWDAWNDDSRFEVAKAVLFVALVLATWLI